MILASGEFTNGKHRCILLVKGCNFLVKKAGGRRSCAILATFETFPAFFPIPFPGWRIAAGQHFLDSTTSREVLKKGKSDVPAKIPGQRICDNWWSPVSGRRLVCVDMTLMGVLVFGPMALLPTTFLEISKPKWGGFLLCISALLCIGCIWMNNQYEWGFAAGNFWTATASIAVPMFLVGCYYIKSAKHLNAKHQIRSTDEPEEEPRLVVNEKTTEKNRVYIG